MYVGKLVFSQVIEHARWHTLHRLVSKYRGDFNVRSFNRLGQLFFAWPSPS